MAERNYPREWQALLQAETARWVEQGMINDVQRASILALYPGGSSNRDRTILIFTILGSLLVGAGVILFLAANWKAIPATVKLATVIGAVVASYGAGYHLQFRRGDYPWLGQSLILLGGLLYGAGIWLVAQIFHLSSHWPVGFLLWGAGLLPVVYAVGSIPVLYLSTAMLLVWNMGEQTSTLSYNVLFPLLALGMVAPLARRAGSALAEAGVLGGLFFWLAAGSLMHATLPSGAEPGIVARLMMLYGAGLMLVSLARLGDTRAYLGVGGLLTLIGSYILTFRFGFLHELPMPALTQGGLFQVGAVGGLLAAVAGLSWWYWQRGDGYARMALPAALVPVAAALSVHLLDTVPRMIAFNLVLFGGTVALIVLGVRQRSQLVVNLGLSAFLVHVLTRYFDLFFSAMNKSLFFVLGGVLLLGGGWLLERNRRRWMKEWGGEGHDR